MTESQKLACRVLAATATRGIGAAYIKVAQDTGHSMTDCLSAYLTEIHLPKIVKLRINLGLDHA